MATIPNEAHANEVRATPALLNAIAVNLEGITGADRIPTATQDNIVEYGSAILSYQALQNAFIDNLVNVIGRVDILRRSYRNSLSVFKKGFLEYGDTIEQEFTNFATAHGYDPESAASTVEQREKPNTSVIFHKMNRQDFYKQTTSEQQLRQAFYSYAKLQQLMDSIYNAMTSGNQWDEYICTKCVIGNYAANNLYYVQTVSAVTDENSAKALARAIRTKVKTMETKPCPEYNAMAATFYSRPEDLVLILSADVEAYFTIDLYAYAFNLSKVNQENLVGRVVVVDELAGITGAQAILCDKEFIQIYDILFEFRNRENGEGLYWNNWLHVWQIFSTCRIAPAILFTTESAADVSVVVYPSSLSIPAGNTIKFRSNVAATFSTTASFTDPQSHLTESGELKLGSKETVATVPVKATSIKDNSKTATATVTVTNAAG